MRQKIITVKWLNSINACSEAVEAFAAQKEQDTLRILKLLIATKEREKLDWANWLITHLMTYKMYVSYAVYAAEQVIDIYEKQYPDDSGPHKAIMAAKKCIKSPTRKNKNAAYSAYWAAHRAADRAADRAYRTANRDVDRAYRAAYSAAHSAHSAANSAHSAAHSAYRAAYSAVDRADLVADRALQIKILRYGIKLLKKQKSTTVSCK